MLTGEDILDEDTPLAGLLGGLRGGAWALLNLILALLTALGSVLMIVFYLGKKKKRKDEEEDENEGTETKPKAETEGEEKEEELEYTVKKHGFWRLFSIIPGIGAIIVFILTEDIRLPMVFTDRWTLLMFIIALVQLIVALLAMKKKERPEEEKEEEQNEEQNGQNV